MPETEPCVVAPLATPVAVAVRMAVWPEEALSGTEIFACISAFSFAFSTPTLQVCDPSPEPQTLKTGAAKPRGASEICTVTSSATPPVGWTSIVYSAVCPGWVVRAVACTLMQSSVAAGEADESDEAADEDEEPVDDPDPGVTDGEGPGGGELGDVGSAWHTPLAAFADAPWAPARAAAVVPTHTTATPANAARTADPDRVLRRGTPGRDESVDVNSRFSIMG